MLDGPVGSASEEQLALNIISSADIAIVVNREMMLKRERVIVDPSKGDPPRQRGGQRPTCVLWTAAWESNRHTGRGHDVPRRSAVTFRDAGLGSQRQRLGLLDRSRLTG